MKITLKVGDVTVECEAATDDSLPPLTSLAPYPPGSKDAFLSMGPQAYAESSDPRRDYDKRMGIIAKHHLTVGSPIDATWIVDRVKDRIAGKNVVEIGAGVGYLAVELAAHARSVIAIEADVKWSWEFASKLYETKPRNLMWIFDRVENVIETLYPLRFDVAIVVTGSDEIWLRELAGKMADVVILPWQDYNGGKAVIADGGVSL